MRKVDFNGSNKTIAATTAQTLTWTGSDLPGSQVVAFLLTLQAAGNTLADVDRVRVKARGSTIYDLTTAQLRGFLEATNKARPIYATTGQSIMIPFFDLMEPNELDQDLQQFPYGEVPTVEVVLNTGSAAGTAIMGWITTDQVPAFYPRLLSSACNVGASAFNGRMNISEPDDFRGFSIVAANLNRTRLVLNGDSVLNVPGTGYATGIGDLGLELTKLNSAQVSGVVSDPLWHLIRSGVPAAPGRSWLELDTGAGWSAANEVCIYGRSRQAA